MEKAVYRITCLVTEGQYSNVPHPHDAVSYDLMEGYIRIVDTQGVEHFYPFARLVRMSVKEAAQ